MRLLLCSHVLLICIAAFCFGVKSSLADGLPSNSTFPALPAQSTQQKTAAVSSVVEELADVACALTGNFCPPPPPAPQAASPPRGAPQYENGQFYYQQQRTRFTNPGLQTRTNIEETFPAQFFNANSTALTSLLPTSFLADAQDALSPGSSYGAPTPGGYGGIFSAGNQSGSFAGLTSYVAAPPVANSSNGGWTMYSTDSGVTVIHLTALSNGQLHLMERPDNRETPPNIAAVYNLNNNTFRYFPMNDNPFCSGHIQLINDKVLVVGGDNVGLAEDFVDGRFNIRVFTGGANPSYQIVAQMQPFFPPSIDPNSGGRWYPSLCTMVDGNVLIVSGETTEGGGYGPVGVSVNPTYQFFQVNNNTITANKYIALIQDTNPINLYPFTTVLAGTGNGLVMMISGKQTRFYRYTPGTLTNDTTTFPAVPDLPIPILYPFTASMVLLPLELPDYRQRILLVGGPSTDFAGAGTPSTPNTYLLDLSVRPLVWRLETMSVGRVMPDTVLLADGTLFICNGGDTGTAGGGPGNSQASNVNSLGARAGEIYYPSRANGTRFGGLLANSGRDRLYHSIAFLTTNAEVMVTGSEVTEDYTMQLYTPPYLVGTFVRPLIASASNQKPGYGTTFTVTLTFAGGSPVSIGRVIVNRAGGVTHSTHFDQRQVACQFTTLTSTMLRVTAPPNATIAPPGIYQLFVVSSTGRPSKAYNLGLGGATPQAPFFEPTRTPTLANGYYVIRSTARAACNSYLNAPPCNVDNSIAMDTAGVWQLTYLPTASPPNTYQVINFARFGSCNSYLGAQQCSSGNDVYVYGNDDISGRQQWTITPVSGGGYSIQVLVGRENCAPPASYLTTVACGAAGDPNAVSMMGNTTAVGFRTWNITAVAKPAPTQQTPFVPYFANATYIITNNGRSTCANGLNTSTCAAVNVFMAATSGSWKFTQLPNAVRTNTYELSAIDRPCDSQFLSTGSCPNNYVDLLNVDDGSGRQQYTFKKVTGGYNIIVYNGRPCNRYLSAQACATSTELTFTAADDNSGLQVWTVSNPSTAPLFANGIYQIASTVRNTCTNVLGAVPCASGNTVNMQAGGSYMLIYLPTAPLANTYLAINTARNGTCNAYLSASSCGANYVDMFGFDDSSGRQQFTFTKVASGAYTITVVNGRAGCNNFLSTVTCATGNDVTFTATNDGTGLQVWAVTPFTPAPPGGSPLLASGEYVLAVTGRAACDQYLSTGTCASGNAASLGPLPGRWMLTYIVGALNPNTYSITSIPRTGQCNQYLSSGSCPSNYADMFSRDDGSGRQQWTIAPATGAAGSGYTITILNGRTGCATFFGGPTCAAGDALTFANTNDGSGLQVWSIAAPGPPPPPAAPRLFADGQYQLVNAGRASCAASLGAATCTQGNGISMQNGGVWTLTYLTGAPNANTYSVQSTARVGSCNELLSASDCNGNYIDLFSFDDNSGRQQVTFVRAGSGYFMQVLRGRSGCGTYLSTLPCSSTDPAINAPFFASTNDSSGLQIWNVVAPAPPAQTSQILPNGPFYIISSGRNATGCNSYLSALGNCTVGDATTLAPGDGGTGLQVWTLSFVPNAPQANTYDFTISARTQCKSFLSAPSCPNNGVDFAGGDDLSGRQQWTVTSVGAGIYTITMPQGRTGCEQFLNVGACASGSNTVNFAAANANNGLQTWTFVPVNPAAG